MTEPAPKVEWKVLGFQLFLLPLFIVAVCGGIFLLFGMLAGEKKDAHALLAEVKRHAGYRSSLEAWESNPCWHAAQQLSGAIREEKPALLADAAFRKDLVALFGDPRLQDDVRAWAAMALGELGIPEGTQALMQGLADGSEEHRASRYACAWALGVSGAHEAVPALAGLLDNPSPALRKMCAHALGVIGDEAALKALPKALADEAPEVKFTAAIWLGSRRQAGAAGVLGTFLNRAAVETAFPGKDREQERETVLADAARAAGALRAPALRPALETLAQDSNAATAMAAKQALLAWDHPEKVQPLPTAP